MTTLELLTIPGMSDSSDLLKTLADARKRMVKAYNQEALAIALANAKAKSNVSK